MGITELITPLASWMSIERGDVIYSRQSGIPRIVLSTNNGCVRLQKVVQGGTRRLTTVYVPCDRHFFVVPDKYYIT